MHFIQQTILIGLLLASPIFYGQNQGEKTTTKDVAFNVIDQVPIYKGCEEFQDNESRKSCMSKKISEFVAKEFNINKAANLGLFGKQRISVQFKIDKRGEIVDILVRAPHPQLEKETIRVIELMPNAFKPGYQKGDAVGVLYSLPIVFNVVETAKEKKKRLKAEKKARKKST